MAKVKCLYCGQYFDREKEPCVKVGRRYAHQECYDSCYGSEDIYKEKLYSFIKILYGPKYDYLAIERQRVSYNKNNISNQEIYEALKYYYEIKKNSIDGANGRIGIIPYIIEESRRYYQEKEKMAKKISNVKELSRENVNLEVVRRENTFKKELIDLDSLE